MIEPGLEPLSQHRCPSCNNSEFFRGPSDGCYHGIECKRCGERFEISVVRRIGHIIDGKIIMCPPEPELVTARRLKYNGYWLDRGDW